MRQADEKVDYVVIGGGFYGCCLALLMSSLPGRVLLLEAGDALMDRASRVNQARIHTGFHYPRSALTAVKSMTLHQKFIEHFSDAVVGDGRMLYAIARSHSQVSAKRFYRMFRDLGAPIEPAAARDVALFDMDRIEAVFACGEAVFDYVALRRILTDRLRDAGVDVRLNSKVDRLDVQSDRVNARVADAGTLTARYAFNTTYSALNELLSLANCPPAPLKHEMAEIALIEPPDELVGLGVTVMDGPFFSVMPFPADGLHSLTHVRYTPHAAWNDGDSMVDRSPKDHPVESHIRYMINDAQRYLPCIAGAVHRRSMYEVKTVLTKNEVDDGRPILFHRQPQDSRLISILGGKIDNVFDLFALVRQTVPEFADANLGRLFAPVA